MVLDRAELVLELLELELELELLELVLLVVLLVLGIEVTNGSSRLICRGRGS
jgi:hypothetical protein